jgi:glycosyltransferase involved in cell wall biosynthesis
LSRRICEFEADPADRARRASLLEGVAQRYNWDDVAVAYRDLCRQLAAGTRQVRPSGRRSGTGWTDDGPARPAPAVLVAHPSPDLYGSDRMLLESVSAFTGAGLRAVVTLPESGPLAEALSERGAEVVFCPSPVLRKSALRPLGMIRLIGETLASLPRSLKLLSDVDPGLVYVNTLTIPLWILLARLGRRRVVCHVHEAEKSAAAPLRRALYAPLLLAQRILVTSRFSDDVITSTWPMLKRRTALLYNGVPGPEGPIAAPRERLSRARLLFIGRLSPRKGPQVAIEALRRLVDSGVDVELALLGEVFGGYEWFGTELREQVDRAGLTERVSFLGFDPDIWGHLAHADLVLVPSTVDEPFGNTAVEAMLAERPLIVSRTSGLQEAAAGYPTATFVTPDDPGELAAAICESLNNWGTLRSQVVAARDLALERHAPAVYQRRVLDLCGVPAPRISDEPMPTGSR